MVVFLMATQLKHRRWRDAERVRIYDSGVFGVVPGGLSRRGTHRLSDASAKIIVACLLCKYAYVHTIGYNCAIYRDG
jgi:hypothetical protein